MTADADLAADDMSDQSDDDDDERRKKGDHGAAFELTAEGIIERQQRHRARLARAEQYHGADIARRRDKAEQPDDDECRRQERDQDPPDIRAASSSSGPSWTSTPLAIWTPNGILLMNRAMINR